MMKALLALVEQPVAKVAGSMLADPGVFSWTPEPEGYSVTTAGVATAVLTAMP